MSSEKEMKSGQPENALETHKLSAAESVLVTIKILAGFGVVGAALWGIDQWASGK